MSASHHKPAGQQPRGVADSAHQTETDAEVDTEAGSPASQNSSVAAADADASESSWGGRQQPGPAAAQGEGMQQLQPQASQPSPFAAAAGRQFSAAPNISSPGSRGGLPLPQAVRPAVSQQQPPRLRWVSFACWVSMPNMCSTRRFLHRHLHLPCSCPATACLSCPKHSATACRLRAYPYLQGRAAAGAALCWAPAGPAGPCPLTRQR